MTQYSDQRTWSATGSASPIDDGLRSALYTQVEGAGCLPRGVRSEGLLAAGVIRNLPYAGWRDVPEAANVRQNHQLSLCIFCNIPSNHQPTIDPHHLYEPAVVGTLELKPTSLSRANQSGRRYLRSRHCISALLTRARSGHFGEHAVESFNCGGVLPQEMPFEPTPINRVYHRPY